MRDLRSVRELLEAAGVAIEEEPEVKPWGLFEMVARDPDRLALVFVEVPPEHPSLCYAFCRGFAVCMSNMGRPEAVYSWGRKPHSVVGEDNRHESKDVAQRDIPFFLNPRVAEVSA